MQHVGCAEGELERARFPNIQTSAENLFSPEDRAITAAAFEHLDVKAKAVLFHTAWDMHWRTEDYSNGRHPFLSADAAAFLATAGAALVGVDSYNIDDISDGRRPAHSFSWLPAYQSLSICAVCANSRVPVFDSLRYPRR